MMSQSNVEQARFNMIEQQIRPWDVLDPQVLDVIAATPRELFVPAQYKGLAFMDLEIPLGHGEFMMAPKLEARALQALALQPSDVVLEIGTGSGYLTACLAKLAAQVHSVDIHEEFKLRAAEQLKALGLIDKITLRCGDAANGWSQGRRYDAIVLTGSLPEYRDCFAQSLNPGGRLFAVVGEAPVMQAQLITRRASNSFSHTNLFETDLKALTGVSKAPVFLF